MADILAGKVGEQFKLEKYEAQLALTLNAFRKKNFMCDVVLVCREREYLAHRNVLSAASPYFRYCFTDSADEAPPSQGIHTLLHKFHLLLDDAGLIDYEGEFERHIPHSIKFTQVKCKKDEFINVSTLLGGIP